MATALNLSSSKHRAKSFVERWYFVAMAIVMLAVSMAGFMPAIVHPAGRRAPLSLLRRCTRDCILCLAIAFSGCVAIFRGSLPHPPFQDHPIRFS